MENSQEREMSQNKKEFESDLEGEKKEEGVCPRIRVNSNEYYVNTPKIAALPIFQVFLSALAKKCEG